MLSSSLDDAEGTDEVEGLSDTEGLDEVEGPSGPDEVDGPMVKGSAPPDCNTNMLHGLD